MILVQDGVGINIYNNYIYDTVINDVGNIGVGISINGNHTECYDNNVYNNTIINSDTCIYSKSINTTYIDNNFNCYNQSVLYDSFDSNVSNLNNAYFLNNIYLNDIAIFKNDYIYNVSITINETSSDYHHITLSNGAVIKFDGDYRKDLKVTNTTYQMYSVPTYNVLCNASTNCNNNVGLYTNTLSASTFSLLLKLDSDNDPKPTKLTSVTNVDYAYTDETQLLLNFTGTSMVMTNMLDIDVDHYEVFAYLAGVYQTVLRGNDTTLLSSGAWLFNNVAGLTSQILFNRNDAYVGVKGYSSFLRYLPILATIFVISIIILTVFVSFQSGRFTDMNVQEAGNSFFTVVVILSIVLTITIMFISMMIQLSNTIS